MAERLDFIGGGEQPTGTGKRLDWLATDKPTAPAATKAETAAPDPGLWAKARAMGTGFMDPIQGAAQAGQHIIPLPAVSDGKLSLFDPEALDKPIREREQSIKAEQKAGKMGGDFYRSLGATINPLSRLGLGGVKSLLGKSVLGGTAAGAFEPVVAGDYWHQKEKQILEGTVAGTIAHGLSKTVGGAIAPVLDKSQAALRKAGVTMTPGQALGGITRRVEELAKSFPILGHFIRGAEKRSIQSFNKATINQALEPIGAQLPPGVEAGKEAIAFAQAQYDRAYSAVLPQIQVTRDINFDNAVNSVVQNARTLDSREMDELRGVIKRVIDSRFPQNTQVRGDVIQAIDTDLRLIKEDATEKGNHNFAHAVGQLRRRLIDAQIQQNPAAAKDLSNLKHGYKMLSLVEAAAARRAGSARIFSPQDLQQAVKDKAGSKKQYARGDALMSEWADYASDVLPNKVPDSGTAEREALQKIARGVYDFGAGGVASHFIPGYFGASLGGAGLYSKPAVELFNKSLTPGTTRQAVGNAARQAGPYVSPMLQRALDSMGPNQQ